MNMTRLTRDKDESRGQDLEGDDTLALEASSQEDEDSARGDAGADLRSVSDRGRTLLDNNILSRIVLASHSLRSLVVLVLESEFLLYTKQDHHDNERVM